LQQLPRQHHGAIHAALRLSDVNQHPLVSMSLVRSATTSEARSPAA
jgi:hypothetical protein